MNDVPQLRSAIIGLIGFTAVEEELLLAVELNADLVANVRRDADLAVLRDSGQLDPLLAS